MWTQLNTIILPCNKKRRIEISNTVGGEQLDGHIHILNSRN